MFNQQSNTHGAVEPKCKKHEEEDDCPDGGTGKERDRLGVHLEHQASPCNAQVFTISSECLILWLRGPCLIRFKVFNNY